MDISDITVDTALDEVRTRTLAPERAARGDRPRTLDADASGPASPRPAPVGFGTLLGNPRRIRL